MIKKISFCTLLLLQLCLVGCGPVGAAVNTTANVAIGVTSVVASTLVGVVTSII